MKNIRDRPFNLQEGGLGVGGVERAMFCFFIVQKKKFGQHESYKFFLSKI
jgi:hypothetical protein